MIALASLRNVEFGFFFGEILSISGSRSQISLPWKFICCRPKLKYSSWTNVSFKSKVVVPPVLLTSEEKEAMVILYNFLTEQGFSSAFATSTINKSDLFIEHLMSRLDSLKNGSPVGDELTVTEIRDALIPYLESLLEDYGSNLIYFLENFPDPPAKGFPVDSVSSNNSINSRRLKALTRVTGTGPEGQLPPHILYLQELGMDIEHIKKIICRYPGFAYLSLDGKVRPMIEFLQSLGLSNSEISTILLKMPHLCTFNLSKAVIPIVKFLENLGLKKRQLAKVTYRYPILLGLRRQKLETIVDFLYEMGLSAEGIAKVFSRFPHIAGYSVENNLQPTVDYFLSLGIRIDAIMMKWPQAFALSIEDNLKPTTEFFLSKGYSGEEVTLMVSRFGGLYMCSLSKNLIPKWEFFLTMNYPKKELIKFPQYFSYSLEGRIKPRFAAVEELGVEFSLNAMLALTDDKFVKALRVKMFKQSLR